MDFDELFPNAQNISLHKMNFNQMMQNFILFKGALSNQVFFTL